MNYMVIENSFSNHLIPIIALYVYQYPRYMHFSMYTSIVFPYFFSLNSEGFANNLKTKNQMTCYIIVQDGIILL